jgi:hypothetical protein
MYTPKPFGIAAAARSATSTSALANAVGDPTK